MLNEVRAVELKCYIQQLPRTIKSLIVPYDECVYISVLASLMQPKNKMVYYCTDKHQQVQLHVAYIKNEIKYYIAGVFSNEQ